eukprot:COSAG05_NODE_3469_length_2040_cov_3.321484_1_plen_83_part_00
MCATCVVRASCHAVPLSGVGSAAMSGTAEEEWSVSDVAMHLVMMVAAYLAAEIARPRLIALLESDKGRRAMAKAQLKMKGSE